MRNSSLIVDNTLENLKLLTHMLAEHKSTVQAARNGAQALPTARGHLSDLNRSRRHSTKRDKMVWTMGRDCATLETSEYLLMVETITLTC